MQTNAEKAKFKRLYDDEMVKNKKRMGKSGE